MGGLNTYGGNTLLSAGALAGGVQANTFSDNSAFTVNTSAMLDLAGFNNHIGSLAGTGIVTNSMAGTALLTEGDLGTSTNFNGTIQNGAGIIGLTKNGAGILSLGGLNTYSGNTLLSAGTLAGGVQANTFSDNSAVTVSTGAALDLAGFNNHVGSLAGTGIVTNSMAGTALLTEGDLGTSTNFNGTIQNGAGIIGLTKNGAGVLSLGGPQYLQRKHTFECRHPGWRRSGQHV